MNDREWEDYLLRNPFSTSQKVQGVLEAERRGGPPQTIGQGGESPLGSCLLGIVTLAVSPLLIAGMLSPKLTEKFVLFRWLIRLGKWAGSPSRRIAFVLGVAGAVVGATFMLSSLREPTLAMVPVDSARAFLDAYDVWFGLLVGAIAGAVALPLVGALVQATAHMTAYCIALSVVVLVLGGVYSTVAYFLDWPQPWEWFAGSGG